ncbi:PepSY domain-containing protein [Salinarimonas soli]|uniref:PepSY domain-containing protein n=1 Tax=Salinarimonas soli TaxID=1638099 RepID=A0A5B2VF71_9HYPH|nr:PepSY domain-containing protein [Salinarimonas soli]KAA2237256.1 PepSY domain-containing protein [Salinarimonas soli]
MHRLVSVLVVLAALAAAARPAAAEGCLSQGDMREVISSNQVVSPLVALNAARRAAPGADVLRAQLCQKGKDLVYILTALRRDGRFVEVTVDATSGRVAALH